VPTETSEAFTPGARLSRLAAENPHQPALVVRQVDGTASTLTRGELDAWSNRLAHRLAHDGVGPQSFVAIHVPTSLEHVVATFAAYKLGACPMPIGYRIPEAERDALLALAAPAAVISDAGELAGISRQAMRALDGYPDRPLPDAVPQPYKAIASGGSTGRPKLVVSPGAFRYPGDRHPFALALGLKAGDCLYSPGPLYHNQAFLFTQVALFAGGSVILNEKFDADQALATIQHYRPSVLSLVPTMMSRMLRAPGLADADLGSVRSMWHLAAPCPEWVKRGWIDLLGADRVNELWAATELTGVTLIRGEEWLRHPGSVGRGWNTEIRILDAGRRPLPPGEVGEVFSRFAGGPAQYRYLGAAALETVEDDFTSVGDLGYLDAEGYLYLADRRVDLVITGGANVVPAEVESALTQHPAVRDAAVIGLKDDDLGRRVHAIVELAPGIGESVLPELELHMRKLLAGYKVPRSYEVIPTLPRDEAGKIRKSVLRDERGG
jgi:bile acid-coenzyme A ligase